MHLFSSFGYVQVFWINDTSVFVALREKAFAVTVIKVKDKDPEMFTGLRRSNKHFHQKVWVLSNFVGSIATFRVVIP